MIAYYHQRRSSMLDEKTDGASSRPTWNVRQTRMPDGHISIPCIVGLDVFLLRQAYA